MIWVFVIWSMLATCAATVLGCYVWYLRRQVSSEREVAAFWRKLHDQDQSYQQKYWDERSARSADKTKHASQLASMAVESMFVPLDLRLGL